MKELPLAWDLTDFREKHGQVDLADVEQRDEEGRLLYTCLISTCLQELLGNKIDNETLENLEEQLYEKAEREKLFYRICYAPGEVIMPKGMRSDFAGILLRGRFHVDTEAIKLPREHEVADCWSRPGPWMRRVVNLLTGRRWKPVEEAALGKPVAYEADLENRTFTGPARGIHDKSGNLRSLMDRATGITSAIWNQPRTVTLVADVDPDDRQPKPGQSGSTAVDEFDENGQALCQMLLINRTALVKIGELELIPDLYDAKMRRFLQRAMPRQLANNRLFRDSIVSDNVDDKDWSRFVRMLRGEEPVANPAAADRIREAFDGEFTAWLSEVKPDKVQRDSRYRIMGELRSLLRRRDLYCDSAWPAESTGDEAKELITRMPELSPAQLARLNRLLIGSAFGGIVHDDASDLPASLYADDVAEDDWPALIRKLQDADETSSVFVSHLRTLCNPIFLSWLDTLSPAAHGAADSDDRLEILKQRFRIMQQLRDLQRHKESFAPGETAGDWSQRSVEERRELNELNREKLLAELPIRCSARRFRPVSGIDFQELAWVMHFHCHGDRKAIISLRKKAKEIVYDQEQNSDALYLIISGMLRVTRKKPAGEMLLNHLDRDGFFGESCITKPDESDNAKPDKSSPAEPPVKHSARVVAQASSNLLKINRAVVLSVVEDFPAVKKMLERERDRMRDRDQTLNSAYRVPPEYPPQEVASRLMVATNLLLIDMDLCTRCDQCVQACSEAHQGSQRFHRANPDPDMRFGKWEVAASCVHCVDAPCQEVCPVGAISTLPTRDERVQRIQIHRNRCVSCSACVKECPFKVIELQKQAFPQEGALEKDKIKLATKCDLCLTETRDPPCVVACPYGAAQRGSPASLFADIQGWAAYGGQMDGQQ